jgi:sulfur-oxidizing protein SoxY
MTALLAHLEPRGRPEVQREMGMQSRRAVMQQSSAVALMLAGLGMLPRGAAAQSAWNKAAFDAHTMDEAMKALGAAKPVASKGVTLQAPDLAENGAMVDVTIATTLPGTRQLLLLVEKNPNILAAVFDLTDAVDPNIAMRIKMAQTSNVVVVAVMNDGRVLYAQKEVKVTTGGCG